MRAKTFLLFIILVTGVAFSQSGKGSARINFKRITYLLGFNNPEVVSAILVIDGYSSNNGRYEKGKDRFDITGDGRQTPLRYSELNPDKFRCDDIKSQAMNEGLKQTNGWDPVK